MKRILPAVALLCAYAASLSAAGYSKAFDFRPATPEELAMKGVSFAPGAPAVVLDWARADDDTIGLTSEYFRIKVFADEGKKYGDVEAAYFPGYPFDGRISEIEARTIQPDGKIVPFTGKVYDKVLYKSSKYAMRAKAFSIQDIQPGSIIEYRYTRRWNANVLFNTNWAIQHDLPVMRARFSIRTYSPKLQSEFGSLFTYSGLPAGKLPQKSGDQWILELENIPAFQREAFMPPEDQLKPRVNYYYTTSNIRPENFWAAQSNVFAKSISSFIGKGGEAQARQWTAGATEPLAKLRQIYARIQAMRNLSFEVEKSESELARQAIKEAKNANDVLASNAGHRDELNRAFVAVARAAGFDASAVRVAPRDEGFFSDKIPDGSQMNGEIAVVTIDGKPLFLDPGTPGAPFGTVSWEKSNVPAILIGRDGKPQWTTVPGAMPADATTRRKADLTMNGESLDGTIVATFTGQEALARRLRNTGEDDAARRKALEDEVRNWLPEGSTVALKSVTGHDDASDALVATFTVSMPNAISRAGSRVLVPISLFAANAKNPLAPATRTHPMYYEHPYVEEDEVHLTLGPGLSIVTVPPPSKLNAGALKYTGETKATKTDVTFTRTMTVDMMLVEQKYYNALRNFYSAMVAADQKPVVLAGE